MMLCKTRGNVSRSCSRPVRLASRRLHYTFPSSSSSSSARAQVPSWILLRKRSVGRMVLPTRMRIVDRTVSSSCTSLSSWMNVNRNRSMSSSKRALSVSASTPRNNEDDPSKQSAANEHDNHPSQSQPSQSPTPLHIHGSKSPKYIIQRLYEAHHTPTQEELTASAQPPSYATILDECLQSHKQFLAEDSIATPILPSSNDSSSSNGIGIVNVNPNSNVRWSEWWTSTFTCPLTNEIFSSGTSYNSYTPPRNVGGVLYYKKKKVADAMAFGRALDCFSHRGGIVLHTKSDGDDKAKKKVMDMLMARDHPRFCVEEPYSVDGVLGSTGKDNVNQSVDRNVNEEVSLEEEKVDVVTPVANVWADEGDDNDDYDYDIDEDDDDEEYTIQHLPGSGGADNAPCRTTMDRILEAWADSPPSLSPSSSIQKTPTPKSKTFYKSNQTKQRQKRIKPGDEAISNALAWYDRMESGVTPNQSFVSVASCNAILNALANTNRNPLRFHPTRGYDYGGFDNVEHLAKRILDRMMDTTTDTTVNTNENNAEDSIASSRRPNADTFNAYMRCLRRSTPLETATVAESLLDDMRHGRLFEGRCVLPPPNVETFNIVMTLWGAVLDDDQSRAKMEELYSILVDGGGDTVTTTTGNDTRNLRPNRGTFLAALSSLSSLPFSPDSATKWIDRMKEHAKSYPDDDSLIIDTQVYNAPLPWSGGIDSFELSASNPWDDYASLFQNGFHSTKDVSIDEATHIENWLYAMEQTLNVGVDVDEPNQTILHTPPNIQTYESIIQAWVRTGTLEGLERAESWAMRAVDAAQTSDPNLSPRFSTFHPIVAAWAYSGRKDGPEMVKAWRDRLEDLAVTMPLVKPDGRMHAALVLAWRNVVAKGLQQDGREEREKNVLAAATNCSEYLETVSHQLRTDALDTHTDSDSTTATSSPSSLSSTTSSDDFLDGSVFVTAIDAWKEASQSYTNKVPSGPNNHDPNASSLLEMLKLAKLLDDLVDFYLDLKHPTLANMSDSNDEQPPPPPQHYNHDAQLLTLMEHTGSLYAKVIQHLCTIATSNQNQPANERNHTVNTTPSTFEEHFPTLENMLRRSDKYDSILHHVYKYEYEAFQNNNLEYPDFFSYQPISSRTFASIDDYSLYSDIFSACETLPSPGRAGDAVRLSMLLLKRISRNHPKRYPNHGDDGQDQDQDINNTNTMVYVGMIKMLGSIITNVSERRILFCQLYRHWTLYAGTPTTAIIDKGPILDAIKSCLPDDENLVELLVGLKDDDDDSSDGSKKKQSNSSGKRRRVVRRRQRR